MIKKDAYSLFSRGLNSYMSRKGYTLDDVAKILDITAQSVHAIRSGKTLPRFDKVFTLVENGMTLYEIFGTELAEKLTAEMKDVLPNTEPGAKDKFDTPEMREIIAKTIGELVEKGYKAINPLK